jgi:hypothetical protein
MKPLSSKKKIGLSESHAPFLSAATRVRANAAPLRRTPVRVARASGKSTSCRGGFSRHATGGRDLAESNFPQGRSVFLTSNRVGG